MNDKQFERFLFIVFILFLLWYWLLRKKTIPITSNDEPMPTSGEPELLTYAANPQKFNPQTVNGTIDINAGYNFLDQRFMPLFGFVGMAQGEMYQ